MKIEYKLRSLPISTKNNVISLKYTDRSSPQYIENNEKSLPDFNNILLPENEKDLKTFFELFIRLYADGIEYSANISSEGHRESGFCEIVSYCQLHIISNLIAKWNLKKAIGTGREKTIICAKNIHHLKNDFSSNEFFMSGRIDLKGRDTQTINNGRFERYAIQMGNQQFATIHIEVGKQFSVRYIRRAFWVSIIINDDVWIGDDFPELPNNAPGTWDSYCSWSKCLKQQLKNFNSRRHTL
jgi:hypothetical protein